MDDQGNLGFEIGIRVHKLLLPRYPTQRPPMVTNQQDPAKDVVPAAPVTPATVPT